MTWATWRLDITISLNNQGKYTSRRQEGTPGCCSLSTESIRQEIAAVTSTEKTPNPSIMLSKWPDHNSHKAASSKRKLNLRIGTSGEHSSDET